MAPFNYVFFGNRARGVQVQVRWTPEDGGGVTWVPTALCEPIPGSGGALRYDGCVVTPVRYDRPDLFFNSRNGIGRTVGL
jgi:hypothetical protein